MFEEEILIPKARIAVLIGEKGSIKKSIEMVADVKIKVSENGSVKISGCNLINVLNAKSVVEAIGRGFNPEVAKTILQGNVLEVISITEYVNKSGLTRIKGVIIGERGRTRRKIEEATKTQVSVYGKTVSIIGAPDGVAKARHAIEMFLTGARHATVYKFLRDGR